VRAGQAQDPVRAAKPLIIDSVEGRGPIAGIRSALAAFPGAAWLVLACDLPFLSDVTVERLLEARDASAFATAYRSTRDGLPEPLCAIWEPRSGAALADFQRGGGSCPRKFLLRHPARLLDADDVTALENINTPDEYEQAQARMAPGNPCS
jgi:molybdopterin-guanine dinucleotide biosynthesis protein A